MINLRRASSRPCATRARSGHAAPVLLHPGAHGGIGQAAAGGALIVLEMSHLGGAGNGAGDSRVRNHVLEKKLALARDIDIGGPLRQRACPGLPDQ